MATTATQKLENPKETVTQPQQQQKPSAPNPTSPAEDHDSLHTESKSDLSILPQPPSSGDESKADASAAPGDEDGSGPVSSIQKKIRRAERFGMPVQLSEEEKRNSRAERFGTGSVSHGSDSVKVPEDQKRKARAERFGLVQSVPSDEAAKKKARLARFAPVLKTDAQEEDKKKARAIRFSQPSSDSLQVNGKGVTEAKTTKAGEGV